MLFARFAALAACMVLAACVTTSERVSFVPGPQQQVIHVNGDELLASRKKVTGVGLGHPRGFARAGSWVPFAIEMRNHGKTPIEFRVQDATVVHVREDGEVVLPIKTFDEIVAAEQKRHATAEFVIGSLAHANVSLAHQARSGVGQARRERREAMEALESENRRNLEFYQQYALQDHTLMPGIHHKGVLFVEAPEAINGERNYTIRIKLGDELHELKVVQVVPKQ
jgi:hypothetical protein